MRRILNLICITSLVFAAFSCREVENPGFVRVEGTSFVNPDGSEFYIKGINLGNWLNPEGYMFRFPGNINSQHFINEGLCQLVGPGYMEDFWRRFVDSYVTEDDIQFIASTGATVVRLPFHYRIFSGDGYLGMRDTRDGFQVIDSLLSWCRKYGIKVILDMHCCPGGQTGDNIDDSYGYPWLFTEKRHQDEFISLWKMVAGRYADDPVILGYDFMNEPISSRISDKDELNKCLQPLMVKVSKTVRKVDPNHIFFIGGAQWNGNFNVFDNFSFDDNMALTCHRYKCKPVTSSLSDFVAVRDRSRLPMYMGETGENTDEWVRSMRAALDSLNIGWTFWPYKKLASSSSFMSVGKPDGWDTICDFIGKDRSSYAKISAARPDQQESRRILNAYLDSLAFNKCSVNNGYVTALGLKIK